MPKVNSLRQLLRVEAIQEGTSEIRVATSFHESAVVRMNPGRFGQVEEQEVLEGLITNPTLVKMEVHSREVLQEVDYEFLKRNLRWTGVVGGKYLFREQPFPGMSILCWDTSKFVSTSVYFGNPFLAVAEDLGTLFEASDRWGMVINPRTVILVAITDNKARAHPKPFIKKLTTVWDMLDDDAFND